MQIAQKYYAYWYIFRHSMAILHSVILSSTYSFIWSICYLKLYQKNCLITKIHQRVESHHLLPPRKSPIPLAKQPSTNQSLHTTYLPTQCKPPWTLKSQLEETKVFHVSLRSGGTWSMSERDCPPATQSLEAANTIQEPIWKQTHWSLNLKRGVLWLLLS